MNVLKLSRNGFLLLAVSGLILVPLKADENLTPVRTLLKQNRLEEAVTVCRQIEVLSTKDNDDFKACAWVYYRSKMAEAGDAMRLKLKGMGGLEAKLLNAYSYILRSKFEEARNLVNQVEQEGKGTPFLLDAQELSALIYEEQGQVDTAAFLYKLVIGDDAQRTYSQWGLARHYLRQKEMKKALTHLEFVAKAWPTHMESRYELGKAALDQGDDRKAGKWLAESYKLNRGDAKVLESLGLLFERKNKIEDAVRYWQRAFDLAPETAEVSKSKLVIYYKQFLDEQLGTENLEAALELVELVRKLDPQNVDVMLQRGIIYRKLGKFQKAAGDLTAYLQSKPKDSNALKELGICYINLELSGDAAMAFSQALVEDPNDGESHAWIAYIYESKNELQRARFHWKKAVQFLKDTAALKKATRKLATIEEQLKKDTKE